jgi:predicted pyridoxine 5'-phosphate oxidase superfamily flavin-nucleotide-binding protein
MSSHLTEFFNKQPRLGGLSTASKDGKPNIAYFLSPHMIDEKTVVMALGNNKTFANLLENPYAAFMIFEPGMVLSDWKGLRVYLKMKEYQTSGEKLEMMREQVGQMAGAEPAKMVHAAVTFEVQEVRPLVDFGQGWSQAI